MGLVSWVSVVREVQNLEQPVMNMTEIASSVMYQGDNTVYNSDGGFVL